MWKLRNIKWWLQISISILEVFRLTLGSAKWKSASFHLAGLLSSLRQNGNDFAQEKERKNLVKLKTYKSHKSCYVEPQRRLWKAGICVGAGFINYSHGNSAEGKSLFEHLRQSLRGVCCENFHFPHRSLRSTFGGLRANGGLLAFEMKLISKLNRNLPLSPSPIGSVSLNTSF